MTKLIYLTDSYLKILKTKVTGIVKKGQHWEIKLAETIFYPQGGGQPSDKGKIIGKNGQIEITHVRMNDKDVIHEGKMTGNVKKGDLVELQIDWENRNVNMQNHSAGHILHEVIMETVLGLVPIKADHGKNTFIMYQGNINLKLLETLEKRTNMVIADGRNLTTEMITYDEIVQREIPIYGNLPKNKPLRLMTIDGFKPIPDGGTQVAKTNEVGNIKITKIENNQDTVKVFYQVDFLPVIKEAIAKKMKENLDDLPNQITLSNFSSLIMEQQQEINDLIQKTPLDKLEILRLSFFGPNGKSTKLIKLIKNLSINDRKSAGMLVNEFKTAVNLSFEKIKDQKNEKLDWFDTSLPGIPPLEGHLHIVTQAIIEITRIFEKIGFTRVRHPEVDWDFYPFESLNMPLSHPAADEWETFHIQNQKPNIKNQKLNSKFSKIVLTPHTSNGQVREMEKGKLPIRMINIAKCYRRQIDVSHTPMFHQFEGLYIDKNVGIAHLKGVVDYFFKQFYGFDRVSRLRPFHFQFTEPSFEIDVSCGICHGTGILKNGNTCKLCKEGWLELGGAGMVHPTVLKNGGIDPEIYNGFAFGWGIERTYMMKSGTQLNDIRPIYENDLRFLEQF